ncbi:MAG: glycoside hydrolase family 18 protein [Limisphaerales bacterium]
MRSFLVLAVPGALFLALLPPADAFWITGYYPQYESGVMAVSAIDFATVTHAIHFCLEAQANGMINSATNGLDPAACRTFVQTVHNAGRKALICVVGANSEAAFQGATTSNNLPAFISALVAFMSANNYDGLDIDWEPLSAADILQYTHFVTTLRAAVHGALLTVAAPAYPPYGDPPDAIFAMFASLQGVLDQINIMTYDLSGPYPGWITWFNSPIYDGGYTFPSTGGPLPSIDRAVDNYVDNGVDPLKLALGLPFYGYIWTGVVQPRQAWSDGNIPAVSTSAYRTIITSHYQSNAYHWDISAQAAYLSLTNAQSAHDMFVSYENPTSCQTKVSYSRNRGLGGIMIWELSQDFFPNQVQGQQSPLLQALSNSLATPQILSADMIASNFVFSFSTLPLAQYRVLYTTNLTGEPWQTLTNLILGTGVPAAVTDARRSLSSVRLYRVQTPP